MTSRAYPERARSRLPPDVLAAFAAAVLLSAAFIAIASSHLDTLMWEYDEGPFMLGARSISRGLRPFVDFAVHQPPLHLYLLALSGKVFGATLFGYRMLSVMSVALSGFLLFCLVRPFAGPLPGLFAQAVFLFSPSQMHALNAVGEPPMLLFTLLGVAFLFLGRGRPSAYLSGVAFVAALLIKPTCLLMVLAAALSLVYARAWRRLGDFAVAGVIAGAVGLAWLFVMSDGIFTDILRYTARRVGARTAGLWDIDSGFPELRRLLGIETHGQWTLFCFRIFWLYPVRHLPMGLFFVAFLGIPVWVFRCARGAPALRAFAVLWPASYVLTNFIALDYVSSKYFVPFLAFTAFLLAGLVWLAERYVPPLAVAAAGVVMCGALMTQLASSLGRQIDPWYYGRADWITHEYPRLVSFSPIFFAATGTEPGCGLSNPPDTYGAFGEAILGGTERLQRFKVSEAQLIECLRAHPETRVVIDFWYYFFTRPGSALRGYLRGEGSEQPLFFSPEALAQWDQPRITIGAVSR